MAHRKFYRWLSENRHNCKHSKCSVHLLSLNPKRFAEADTPKLKSKGRPALCVNQWLLSICERDTSSPHFERRCSVLWGYHESFEIIKKTGVELTSDELASLNATSQAILNCSRGLCANSISAHNGTWRLIPKHHGLLHLFVFALSSKINPALAATWSDEDFVGWVGCACLTLHRVTVEHQIIARFVDCLRAEFIM